MKRLYYIFLEFKVDILTTFLAIIGIILTWKYAQSDALKSEISLIIAILVLLVIVYIRSLSKDFIFSSLTRRKDKDDWIGQGTFEYSRGEICYEITSAEPGYINANTLTWSNYKVSFDFKIDNTCIGLLIRAVNLSNCVMSQITLEKIRPHVKLNNNWVAIEPSRSNLKFKTELDQNVWYKCRVRCDKYTITTDILNSKNKLMFSGSWDIPNGDIMFEYKHSDEHPTEHSKLPIGMEFGSIGFRNYGDERAFIKNVLIEKL